MIPNPALENELASIASETKIQLRQRYIKLFECEPPRAFGPDLLRRSVAQQLQVQAYGGLSKTMQRELDRLVAAFITKPGSRLAPSRKAQFGTVLVRQWKDRSYRVSITEDGFSFEGRTFSNLSEIARLITGTRWNGPRFFGLRRQRIDQQGPLPGLSNTPGIKVTKSTSQRRRVQHGL